MKKITDWYHYVFMYEIRRRREGLLLWVVHRLPREVAYRACIRVGADATTGAYGNQNVPELYFMDALERWSKRDGGDRSNKKFRQEKVKIRDCGGVYIGEDEKEQYRESELSEKPVPAYDPALDLATAIVHTVEYVGNDMLPAQEGWSWFDALNRYDSLMTYQFVEKPIHFPPSSSLDDREIDRNARAYGFEIGRGQKIKDGIVKLSPDNPFVDRNWRSTLLENKEE